MARDGDRVIGLIEFQRLWHGAHGGAARMRRVRRPQVGAIGAHAWPLCGRGVQPRRGRSRCAHQVQADDGTRQQHLRHQYGPHHLVRGGEQPHQLALAPRGVGGGRRCGIDLTQRALSTAVGSWGAPFVAIAIFFFAFTSIIANYAYAESNLVFLEHNHPGGLLIFRCVALGMVMFGSVGELPTVWALADVSMGLMAIVNLVAILLLSGVAIKLAKDYNDQLKVGRVPTFDANKYPELRSQLEEGIWDNPGKK